MKKTIKYPVPANIKLTKEIGDGLEMLNKAGVDVGELKRDAISRAVREALEKLEKSAC